MELSENAKCIYYNSGEEIYKHDELIFPENFNYVGFSKTLEAILEKKEIYIQSDDDDESRLSIIFFDYTIARIQSIINNYTLTRRYE